MRIASITCACWMLMVGAPALAHGAVCSPPGNSGVSQYSETIPGVSCNHPSSGPGSGGGGGSLPRGTEHRLSRLGAVGKAVTRLVRATGPAPTAHRRRSHRHRPASGATVTTAAVAPTGSARGPFQSIVHAVDTSASAGGLGWLAPVLLTVVLMGVLGGALVRRRRTSAT